MQQSSSNLFNARKNNKLKYIFEELIDEEREPTKFYGYQDESFSAGVAGANANFAIMIYDVNSIELMM